MRGTVPFKLNLDDWSWGEVVEISMTRLRDEIAAEIVEGLGLSLGAMITDYVGRDQPRGDFRVQVYVDDEAAGETLAERFISLTEMVNLMDLHPNEVAYKREKFQRLAEEFDALAKQLFNALGS